MFQQQLDVSRVWFIKSDGSTFAHRDIDQSIQNRAVFVVTFSKTQFRTLLENHLTLQLIKDFIHKILSTSKQHVITMSPTYRWFRVVHVNAWTAISHSVPDCSNFLVREDVPFMSRVSRLIERSKKLSNHAR